MSFPFSDSASGVSEPPGDFTKNYKYLKQLINKALKEGTPLEDLHLVQKHPQKKQLKRLSRKDLLRLLATIRRIKERYQELLQCPVPWQLERDILAKDPEDRLPWEDEALEKIEQWRNDVTSARAQVQKELNDHLKSELFEDL